MFCEVGVDAALKRRSSTVLHAITGESRVHTDPSATQPLQEA